MFDPTEPNAWNIPTGGLDVVNVSIILLALVPSAFDLLVSVGVRDDPTVSSGAIEGVMLLKTRGCEEVKISVAVRY